MLFRFSLAIKLEGKADSGLKELTLILSFKGKSIFLIGQVQGMFCYDNSLGSRILKDEIIIGFLFAF